MLTFPVIVRRKLLFLTMAFACFRVPLAAETYAADPFIDSLLGTLSTAEKAGQMILVYNSPYEFLRDNKVGGVLIMQNMMKKPGALRRDLRRAQKKLPIPLLVTIDQEGGTVNRLSPIAGWKNTPSAGELGEWEPDSVRRYAHRVGAKLRELGINMNLAPVVDPAVNSAGRETYMGLKKRSFGSDAEHIAPVARAFITGFSEQNVLCVAKHFPGYDVTTNSDLETAFSDADTGAMAGYTRVFGALGPLPAGIMMTSIRYSAVSDTPAVLSSSMISRARSIAGNSIIMTDDLWTASLRGYILPDSAAHPAGLPAAYPDSAFEKLVASAVRAGNDMLMITYPRKVPLMIATITAMAENDASVKVHVDNAARRILAAKKKLGLFGRKNRGRTGPSTDSPP
ncbi:MAG: glycoside hydrolase family 3 protein [Chitinispirillaceae bacterium]|nr:glycoside hydrolase family 3 protein [Chitinispirillaceae bacterium]